MEIIAGFVVTAYGLILGSFFNVLIWRLPREESIIRPGSHCPRCGKSLKLLENVPVLSFLLLRGRCSGCRTPISFRYPVIEMVTAVLAILAWHGIVAPVIARPFTYWEAAVAAVQALTLLLLVPISVIDLDHYIIPDCFTLPGLACAVVIGFFPGGLSPVQALLGILAGGGSLYAIGLIGKFVLRKEEAMGGGDIKLMAFLGALWGWDKALIAIVIASLLGSLVGGLLIALRRLSGDRRIPFGPFLAAGMGIAVIAGGDLVAWYLDIMDRLFLR